MRTEAAARRALGLPQERRPGLPGQRPVSLALPGPVQPLIPGLKAQESAKRRPSHAKPFLRWGKERGRRPPPREEALSY